ncbi:DUF4132 domain-containing protein [Kitasatospora sp. LaBMicrA B282]|uniref:WGR and DUF4132 domain-containing protein n=1 Tax=Kitasatospora sp. LaBMicrA B282 TaxID=3420949 RepID=UPI003D13F70D
MRRWEFVEGGSEKFWEATVDGAVVTVRHGRIGTAGREQVKELATAEAAQAHLAKAVAEKERKGYRAATGGAPAVAAVGAPAEPAALIPAPAAPTADPAEPAAPAAPEVRPDEDTLVFSESWRRALFPRRGGVRRTPPALARDAVARSGARLDAERDWVEQALAAPRSDPGLVAAARAHQAGNPDPRGAAVLAVLGESGQWDHKVTADAWVAEYGLPFAARACVELFEIQVDFVSTNHQRRNPSLRAVPAGYHWSAQRRPAADRVRARLAACDEQTYRAAVAALADCRGELPKLVAAAYLVPTETAWVDACCRPGLKLAEAEWSMLLCSLSSAEQLARLEQQPDLGWQGWSTAVIATAAEGLGGALAPVLLAALSATYLYSDTVRGLFAALGELPSDEGFRGLLARQASYKPARGVLSAAMRRYPVRALRLLADAVVAVPGGDAAQLLAAHVAVHRDLVLERLPELTPAQAAVVAPLVDHADRVPEVAPETLPELLTSPPWTRKRVAAKPRVVAGLTLPPEQRMHWLPEERAAWAASPSGFDYFRTGQDWGAHAERLRAGKLDAYLTIGLFLFGDEALARPLVRQWTSDDYGWDHAMWVIASRFELDALPAVLHAARLTPASHGPLLLPYLDLEVAGVMADWLVRLKSAGDTARAWFARHGLAAARLLVPAAVGKAGTARRGAEQALRLVALEHGVAAVHAVAAEYGAAPAEVVADLLAGDRLVDALPAKLPAVGDWADPLLLPQVLVRGGGALPHDAVRHLITMLSLSRRDAWYPGLAQVEELCEPASLAEFGWALFTQWQLAGLPAQDAWALFALGRIGDDGTVSRLAPVIRSWPGDGAHQRAVDGLDVLAAIGSDLALTQLHAIGQRVKFKALKARAQQKIGEVAAGLGLSGEQLADRLVPDFGLDANGTTVVDYGTRTFTVGFDEQLKPYVLDADGRRRKDLPAPAAKDDPGLAPAERKRFAALKKDVRTVAADQLRRLETAMVEQRSWTAAEFRQLLLGHPLLRHLVRRLVWLAEPAGTDQDAGAVTAFRVAEDHTLADVQDEEFELPEQAVVRLAHPLLLGTELAAWSELFADYEILQPFRQLGRPVFELTEEEKAGHRLTRFENTGTVPTGRLLGLERRGWLRGEPQDAGVERWLSRRVGPNRYLVLAPEFGIAAGYHDMYPEQRIESVWLGSSPEDYWSGRSDYPTLAELDPVLASELLADLTELTTP